MDITWLKHQIEFGMTQQDVDMYKYRANNFGARPRDVRPLFFGEEILFDRGTIDNWAAYRRRRRQDGTWEYAMPQDVSYFEILWCLAHQTDPVTGRLQYGPDMIFRDMMHIAENTGLSVDDNVIEDIGKMAGLYGKVWRGRVDTKGLPEMEDCGPEDPYWFYNAAMSVYYGMIAEEHKNGTALGRLIKINGLYSCLYSERTADNPEPYLSAAVNCCRMPYLDIFRQAQSRHIILYDHR